MIADCSYPLGQVTGNAGARVACGKIQLSSESEDSLR